MGEWEGERREKKGEEREGRKEERVKVEGGKNRKKGVGERIKKEERDGWVLALLLHTFAGPKTVLVQCSLVARLSSLPGNEAKYSGSILCVCTCPWRRRKDHSELHSERQRGRP